MIPAHDVLPAAAADKEIVRGEACIVDHEARADEELRVLPPSRRSRKPRCAVQLAGRRRWACRAGVEVGVNVLSLAKKPGRRVPSSHRRSRGAATPRHPRLAPLALHIARL